MSLKLLWKFAPVLLPITGAIATPMIDPIRQWVVDHPTETIVTSAIAAIANWLAPSPIKRGAVVKKANNATSLH